MSEKQSCAERLLIVGCGDVARRALPALLAEYAVTALARSPESAATLERLGVHPVSADLDRPETLAGEAWRADCILHCAPPQRGGSEDLRTRNLLDALEGAMVPRSFVYLSTSGVYGDCAGEHVEESRALNPQTDRAMRRGDAEAQLSAWCASRGTRLTILRVPGIYAADRLPLQRLRNGSPALRSEDDVYTNHIHAEDLASIIVLALKAGAPGGVFNACDDSRMRMGDFFDLVADRSGLPRPARLPRAEVLASVSAEMASFLSESRRLSNRRMKDELGARLRYPTAHDGVPTLSFAA